MQLAVQGKLVRQNPSDEPASSLFEKIKVKKEKLIQEKKLKETQLLPAITQNEIEYTIPNTWCWARLANICEFITDGTHYTPKYTEHGRIFLSSQNVKPFSFMPNNHKFVSEEAYQGYIKNRKPEFEDILLTRVGAGIGEAAVIDQELEFAIYVSLGLLRPFKEFIDPYYLVIWLNSPIGTKHSQKNTYGKGVSQGNLNLGLIRGFVVSVPPLAEQKRIVEKCDRLMSLCDTLEAKLKQGRDSSEKLMEVAAKHVLTA
ncbi:MAG: restriction endonuclease subunit S [Nostoc sp.]